MTVLVVNYLSNKSEAVVRKNFSKLCRIEAASNTIYKYTEIAVKISDK